MGCLILILILSIILFIPAVAITGALAILGLIITVVSHPLFWILVFLALMIQTLTNQ